MVDRQILATSGGMVPTGRGPFQRRIGGLLSYAMELTGKSLPRLCFVNTAAGDNDAGIRASMEPSPVRPPLSATCSCS